jgi:hypothetical protein
MSKKKNTVLVYGISAALALMIIVVLGNCENAFDADSFPVNKEARSLSAVTVNMGDIEGEWYSSDYGETFDITDTTLTYSIASWGPVFTGDIVSVTDPMATEGYIYIEYTDALDPSWNGNVYVVKWSYLNTSVTPNTVRLSGCSDGEGKGSVADAEYAYVTNPDQDYFAGYSDFDRVTSEYAKDNPSEDGLPYLYYIQSNTTPPNN